MNYRHHIPTTRSHTNLPRGARSCGAAELQGEGEGQGEGVNSEFPSQQCHRGESAGCRDTVPGNHGSVPGKSAGEFLRLGVRLRAVPVLLFVQPVTLPEVLSVDTVARLARLPFDGEVMATLAMRLRVAAPKVL